MTNPTPYSTVATAYVDAVRTLFAQTGPATAERSASRPAAADDLATQAEQLSPLSSALTRTAAEQLASADPTARSLTEMQLLAKALTDLTVSNFLLDAALDEEMGIERTTERALARSGFVDDELEGYLALLLRTPEADVAVIERSAEVPASLPEARATLTTTIDDTLVLITDGAADTTTAALKGLAGLGMTEMAKAAGLVGMDIATALGQAEPVARFYKLVRDFATKAYDTFWTLLGPQMAKLVGEQVIAWVEKVKEGEPVAQLLNTFYETEAAKVELHTVMANNEAELKLYLATLEQLATLNSTFYQKRSLADKVLPKLKFLRLIPVAQLPLGTLLLAATYIVLAGYVVLAGADCVDTIHTKNLDRVPGVRRLVYRNLVEG